MHLVYLPALVAVVVGIGLLVASVAGMTEPSVFGFTFAAPVVRGLGLIALIIGMIAFLAAYGSTLPPLRRETPSAGERHGKR